TEETATRHPIQRRVLHASSDSPRGKLARASRLWGRVLAWPEADQRCPGGRVGEAEAYHGRRGARRFVRRKYGDRRREPLRIALQHRRSRARLDALRAHAGGGRGVFWSPPRSRKTPATASRDRITIATWL